MIPPNAVPTESNQVTVSDDCGWGRSSLLICVDPMGCHDPLQRESLASWVWRLAQANGFLNAGSLLRSGGGRIQDFSHLDLGPNCHLAIAALTNLTFLPRQHLASLTLTATVQNLGVEESPTGHPWVLNSASLPRKRKGARHAICTSCVREDSVPYWRQFWRLATAVRCPLHHHALIDTCPSCGEPIVLAHHRLAPLEQCEFCGAAYAEHHGRRYRLSRSKWLEIPPLAVQQVHLPLKVIDPLLWWTGLRALLFILCIPRHAKRFSGSPVPSTHLPVLRLISQSPKLDFAQHPLVVRQHLLHMVAWLTDNWPDNFVPTMKSAGVTACNFSAMDFSLPYWVHSVAHGALCGKRYQVGQDEVRAARANLSNATKSISKIALKRQMGVTEGKALDALLPARVKSLSNDTIHTIMDMLDIDIHNTASAREAKSSAIRDACCIAAATWLGLSFTQVCTLTLGDGLALNRVWQALASRKEGGTQLAQSHDIRLARIFCKWGDLYANNVRHRFCRYQQEPNQYFVTRFGRASGGTGLAARFADLLRRAGVIDWAAGARLLVTDDRHSSSMLSVDGACDSP
jgi:hypothetical protein